MEQKKHVHKEQSVENSLTCPSDRDPARTYKPTQGHRELEEKEVVSAMKELNNDTFVHKFLRVERRYADPVDPSQKFALISYVPAKGAKPNEKGVYGFAKVRGNYGTLKECQEKCEYLIRNVDSYHQIYTAYVGRPFPLTTSSKYSEETSEIDMNKEMAKSVSASIKKKKKEDRDKMLEIKDREEKLQEDVKREPGDDPMEDYITLRVKKAQISWTYLETVKKLEEMKDIIIKTRKNIKEIEKDHPSFSKDYYKKYLDARSTAGLSNTSNEDNFMKFLVEDAKLPF
jgi:hypothetical protein